MTGPKAFGGLEQYDKVGVKSSVEAATPHRLVQMLMEGALTRIARARGHLKRGEVSRKGENISSAISIIEGLRVSLDHEVGGELAGNLEALYEYMELTLLEGNLANDEGKFTEVQRLLLSVKEGWDGIPDEHRQLDPEALRHGPRKAG